MESILDALPGQPLTPEAVEALNDAASVRLIPYSWSGTQVVTLLLDEDREVSGGRFEPPERATASKGRSFEGEGREQGEPTSTDERSRGSARTSGFDTDDSGSLGTVEVVEESLLPEDDPFADVIDEVERSVESTDAGQTSDGSAGESTDETTAAGSPIWAVGYDPDTTTWVRIDEVESATAFEDIEPLIREWLTETYSEAMLDRLAVGPSEYDTPD